MTDIALKQTDHGTFDIAIDGHDLATDDGLQTAVIILLFTDNGQWWGDQFFDQPLGSELYKLETAKATQDTLNDAERYATEALQPLLDLGAAKSVDATAEYGGTNSDILGLLITITRPDGTDATFKFNDIWEAQLNGL